MARRATEPETPTVVLNVTMSAAILTPESYAATKRALGLLQRDAQQTLESASRALDQLNARAEERGLRTRARPLEGLSRGDERA